jgi:hypothetical protein
MSDIAPSSSMPSASPPIPGVTELSDSQKQLADVLVRLTELLEKSSKNSEPKEVQLKESEYEQRQKALKQEEEYLASLDEVSEAQYQRALQIKEEIKTSTEKSFNDKKIADASNSAIKANQEAIKADTKRLDEENKKRIEEAQQARIRAIAYETDKKKRNELIKQESEFRKKLTDNLIENNKLESKALAKNRQAQMIEGTKSHFLDQLGITGLSTLFGGSIGQGSKIKLESLKAQEADYKSGFKEKNEAETSKIRADEFSNPTMNSMEGLNTEKPDKGGSSDSALDKKVKNVLKPTATDLMKLPARLAMGFLYLGEKLGGAKGGAATSDAGIFGMFGGLFKKLGPFLKKLFGPLGKIFSKFGASVMKVFSKIGGSISKIFSKIGGSISKIFSKAGGFIGKIFSNMFGSLGKLFAPVLKLLGLGGAAAGAAAAGGAKAAAGAAGEGAAKAAANSAAKAGTQQLGELAAKTGTKAATEALGKTALGAAKAIGSSIPFLGPLVAAGFSAVDILSVMNDKTLSEEDRKKKLNGAIAAGALSVGASFIPGVGGIIGSVAGDVAGRYIGESIPVGPTEKVNDLYIDDRGKSWKKDPKDKMLFVQDLGTIEVIKSKSERDKIGDRDSTSSSIGNKEMIEILMKILHTLQDSSGGRTQTDILKNRNVLLGGR